MIKTTELRLGNLFMVPAHKNLIASVTEIREDYVVCKGGNLNFLLASVEPIPLTTEFLLKLDFVLLTNRWQALEDCLQKKHDLLNFNIYPNFKIIDIKYGNCGSTRILTVKYIHQLQNLFFSLTGEELQIKL